jgi:YbbR domain-containing protein
MKKISIFFALLIFISCSNNNENRNSSTETSIELVTGINIRSSEYSEPIQLGNPNILNNNKFIAYPNPPSGALSLLAYENISDVWITPANAEKIYQQTNFKSILNSELYDQGLIESNAEIEFLNFSSKNLVLNLENLTSGYHRVFVKIDGTIYWDNIYIPDSNFEITDLINYWN